MSRGFDTVADCSGKAARIRAAGYGFVGRYYYSGVSHAKVRLGRAEALALTSAGLHIVTVFENAGDHYGYFTHGQGLADGKSAFRYGADVTFQPRDAPIYFAVDYDASATELAHGILAYFEGIAEAFQTERKGGIAYPVGVYGSGLTCQTLGRQGVATFAWLAQSMGWRGSKAFSEWNLKQGPSQSVLGLEVDIDESQGNGGGWQVPP